MDSYPSHVIITIYDSSLATFIGGLTGSSGTIFSMRCVEPELKAYSMSLLHGIISLCLYCKQFLF